MESAKIFQLGNSQAIQLSQEYHFKGERVYLKRVGNALILIPERNSWDSLIESLELFSDDFMSERAQPDRPADEEPSE